MWWSSWWWWCVIIISPLCTKPKKIFFHLVCFSHFSTTKAFLIVFVGGIGVWDHALLTTQHPHPTLIPSPHMNFSLIHLSRDILIQFRWRAHICYGCDSSIIQSGVHWCICMQKRIGHSSLFVFTIDEYMSSPHKMAMYGRTYHKLVKINEDVNDDNYPTHLHSNACSYDGEELEVPSHLLSPTHMHEITTSPHSEMRAYIHEQCNNEEW